MGDLTLFYRIKRFFIETIARLLPRSIVAECFALFAERRYSDYFNKTWIELWNETEDTK